MKQTLKIFLVFGVMVVLCLAFYPEVMAGTTFVSGTISTNTTWTPAGNPYIVIGGTRVDTNIILTIQPGVIVKFNLDLWLRICGGLVAIGTPSDSIIFTASNDAAGRGYWGAIHFEPSVIDTACVLQYCRIEKAKQAIYCDSASPRISHNLITLNGCGDDYCGYDSPYPRAGAIRVRSGSSPEILNNSIVENYWFDKWNYAGYGTGINVEPGSSPLIVGNTIQNNYLAGGQQQGAHGAGISVRSDFAIVTNNIISGNSYPTDGGGIYISGSPLVTCNMVDSNLAGKGGGIYVAGGSPTISGNTVSKNWSPGPPVNCGGIYFGGGNTSNFNYNNIYDNSDLVNSVFEVYAGYGSTPIDGENNWWGTTDPNMIQLLIYDFWDYSSLREIDYTPFSTDFNTPPPESIIVISPNGGEEWLSFGTYDIRWNPFCFTENVRIEYSTDSGSTWENVIESTMNVGFYSWEIPLASSPNCRIKVSDAADGVPSDVSDNDFSMCPSREVALIAPDSGEILCAGDSTDITWTSACVDSVGIDFSTDGGLSWSLVVGSTPSNGSYMWEVPSITSDICRIKICTLDESIGDTNSNDFSILTEEIITVLTPNGGEEWYVDTTYAIEWSAYCFEDSVMIEYSIDNGLNWSTIDSVEGTLGSYGWIIPDNSSDSCKVKISDLIDGDPFDISDSNFVIRLSYVPGDGNGDGEVTISDVVYLVNYVFKSGPPPEPIQAGDVNCDEDVDVIDAVYLVNYLFKSGPPPNDPDDDGIPDC